MAPSFRIKVVALGHDREDCASYCSDKTTGDECKACCEIKVGPDNPDCLRSCQLTCDDML